jgi:hypothetical protein
MKVDNVITLSNGKNYLLLLEDDFMEEDYFLSVLLDEKNEPTNEYAVFKEVKKNGETFVKKENNPTVLNQLLEDYRIQYEDDYTS